MERKMDRTERLARRIRDAEKQIKSDAYTFNISLRLVTPSKSETFFYDELGLKPIERPWTLILIKT
jgi:hypothetical protein